jgi:hypothetical protein
MKKTILASLILISLSANAFALPQNAAPAPLNDGKTSSAIAADGAERTGADRVAEGGAERLQERFRVAEDGADSTGVNRVAEGGAERLQERFRVAEDGADSTAISRIG